MDWETLREVQKVVPSWTSGEPMLRGEIFQMMLALKRRGIQDKET